MEKNLFLLVLLVVVYLSSAAEYRYSTIPHKDHPNACYIEDEGKAYPFGSTFPKGECIEVVCYRDYSLVKQSCGAVAPPEGFRNEIDTTKPYPDCCVNFVKITGRS